MSTYVTQRRVQETPTRTTSTCAIPIEGKSTGVNEHSDELRHLVKSSNNRGGNEGSKKLSMTKTETLLKLLVVQECAND